MNEIEKIISDLQEQRTYWKMRYKLNSDKDSNKYVSVNDMAIKALKEKQEVDSLIREYDTDCTAVDIAKSFIEYIKGQDNELAGFRILTNADKNDYEAWKRSRDKGCEYCRGEKAIALDYNNDWVMIQENDGNPYMEGADWEERIKFCPMCGRKLNKNE